MIPKVLVVIPARLASTRLPRKMLLPIDGDEGKLTVLQSTFERAKLSETIKMTNHHQNKLIIATCDEEIRRAAERFGAVVCMTSNNCESGSDRVNEAVQILDSSSSFDIVVNVQGDEPFLEPSLIDVTVDGLVNNPWADVATCAEKVEAEPTNDASKVKVVISSTSAALYFSRAPIPYNGQFWFRHVGIYAYRPLALNKFAKTPPTTLEKCEKLEQLRLLESDFKIFVAAIANSGFGGIDTREDLIRGRNYYRHMYG
jgi:3-deoxy-manno-octulosonate cytidylyltransferase (CMP-KDO synthetase)